MSNRGSGRPFTKSYYEHDNRGAEGRTGRSVSFKSSTGGNPSRGGINSRNRSRNNGKTWTKQIQNYLTHDGDYDMGGNGPRNDFSHPVDGRRKYNNNRRRGGNGRQHSPAPNRSFRRLPTSSTFWYKIIVPHAGRYDKKWLIDTLNASLVPTTFTPIGFHHEAQGKDTVVFYLDDFQAASKLSNMDKRISTEDGFKLMVLVRPLNNLNIVLNEPLKETIKTVMAKRFRPDVKSLDLSRFHSDPELEGKFVPLNQRTVFSCVLSLVVEHCPSLHALDLSHNQIYSLEGVKTLVSKLSNLRILHLANNQLEKISGLDALKGLGVEELLMTSNPVCGKYAEQGAYVTDVRKRLPKLLKLDSVDLPPPILFDVETTQIPPSRGSYLCAEEGKDIARQFLEQYYALYDSANREPLRDAYHASAMLSMSCNYPSSHSQGPKEKAMLHAYKSNNRNLKQVMDLDRRVRLLMCGHEEIMKHLCSLPASQHDPNSFAVDLLLYTPQLIQLCVCGVFREARGTAHSPMRAFSRSLIIVPQGQGFCIVNETITVTNATSAQANAAFKTSLVPVAPAPLVSAPVVPLVPVPVSPVGIVNQDLEAKRQMVEHVVRTTGMNLIWSEKCLLESNWNLEQALFAFAEYHRQGSIPEEAFAR
ncbi:nuclear RNA export factor 1 [Frankliniella occidentalis]|uniref:Nuclear RNA export factor 1 n=1 Tax=Frankliniella occidentalis TaxID=133901 RepID=A0A6J1RRK8_FRAOC|nr:nuclear RNA export factor 1 [Frankliniella occidentalis]